MPIDWLSRVRGSEAAPRGALTSGLSSGMDDLAGLGYSAVAAGADAAGAKGVRDWANEGADRNQYLSQKNGRPDLENIEDQSPGSMWDYLKYQVGKQGPNIAGGIVAGALVPEAVIPAALSRGAALLPRALGGGGLDMSAGYAAKRAAMEAGKKFAGQVTGGSAWNYGQSVGSLYQATQDGADNGSPTENAGIKSLIGGVPYAVAETLPEAMLVGRFGHGGTGNLAARVAKGFGSQAATGAASELSQTAMENAYNGSMTDSQKNSAYLNAGVAGGLVEGLMGGLGGIKRKTPKVARQIESGGSVDLVGESAAKAPAQLGFSGYSTGVGEIISMPDGSAMLKSEYDKMMQSGRKPDGSFNYIPPSASDMSSYNPAYQHSAQDGINFDPTQAQVPSPTPTAPNQTQIPAGVPGSQMGLFGGGLDEAPAQTPQALHPALEESLPTDTQTGDLFQQNPSSMVRTEFNPATEPADTQGQSTRGAVAGTIRSQIMQQVGKDGNATVATKLGLDLATHAGNVAAMQQTVADTKAAIEKNIAKLDKQVTGDSNMLTPDEYQAKREPLDRALFTVMAAEQVVSEHQKHLTNAYAEEAQGKAQPGVTVGTAPVSDIADQAIRNQDVVAKTSQVDQEGQTSREAKTQLERLDVIRQALAPDLNGQNPSRKARRALQKAGYNNMNLAPDEQDLIHKLASKQSDVKAATVVPPGLAAKNGKLTKRESLDVQPTEPAAPIVRESKPTAVAVPAPKADAVVESKPEPKTEAPKVLTPVAKGPEPVRSPSPKPVEPGKAPANQTAITDLPTELRRKAAKHATMIDKYESLLSCLLK